MADLTAGDVVTPREFVLADEKGPVDLAGADVTRRVIARDGATQVADLVVAVVGRGRVRFVPTAAEVTPGWHGFQFTARYGPGVELVFPDGGPRWLEAA